MRLGVTGENARVRFTDRFDKKQLEEFGLEFSEKFLSRVGEALEHDLMRLDEDKDARTRVKLLVRFIVCASVTIW